VISGDLTGDRELIQYVDGISPKLRPELVRRTEKLTIILQSYVKKQKLSGQVLKRRTGRLSGSIARRVEDKSAGVTGVVGTNVTYGVAFETTGMKPHVIEARNKKALAFKVGGKQVFARRVNHPGSAARPFLLPALSENEGLIEAEYADALGVALA
jgi:phage gpG-like protein